MGDRRALRTLAAALTIAVAGAIPAFAAAGDPYRPQQWGLERIGAPAAWQTSRGAGQVIAVIDTGVDTQHPDLIERLLRDGAGNVVGYDFVDEDTDPRDEHGHGTMVAGVVAAALDNGVGGTGVSPDARIMPIRVLDETAAGGAGDVDRGIRWAVDHGATVINLSLESAVDLPGRVVRITAPVAAVQYAWDSGVVVVAAAGNSGSAFTDYPRSSPVVLVGATDRDDQRADFSDAGRDDLLMAPGVDIVSTWCRPQGSTTCDEQTHNYGEAGGTSFAAPHVSGAVAILRAAGFGQDQAVAQLRSSARDLGAPGRDNETGYGLVDIPAALAAGPPAPTPVPTSSTTVPTPGLTESPTATDPSDPRPADTPSSASPDPAGSSSPTPPKPVDAGSSTGSSSEGPGPSATPSSTPAGPTVVGIGIGEDPLERGILHWTAVGLVLITAGAVAKGLWTGSRQRARMPKE